MSWYLCLPQIMWFMHHRQSRNLRDIMFIFLAMQCLQEINQLVSHFVKGFFIILWYYIRSYYSCTHVLLLLCADRKCPLFKQSPLVRVYVCMFTDSLGMFVHRSMKLNTHRFYPHKNTHSGLLFVVFLRLLQLALKQVFSCEKCYLRWA